MKERSGMPYDVVAYESDENARLLDPWEEGVFHRMLRLSWMNGSIPSDLTELAHLVRVRPSSLKKAWPKLLKLWDPVVDQPGRLRNKKQENERFFLESKRDANSIAGKLSAISRKNKKIESTNVQQEFNERSTSLPSPSPSPLIQYSNTEKLSPLHTYVPVIAFGEFGWAKLTADQHEKLTLRLNGKLDSFIERFDIWVNEAPDAKYRGVRRRERHAYESIIAWSQKDEAERTSYGQRESAEQGKERRNLENAKRVLARPDSETRRIF